MSVIKKPSDLLIRENALLIVRELANAQRKEECISSYKIARILGIDTAHALSYMKRWLKHGLLCLTEVDENDHVSGYFSLNTEFFRIDEDSVSFEVDDITVILKNGRD